MATPQLLKMEKPIYVTVSDEPIPWEIREKLNGVEKQFTEYASRFAMADFCYGEVVKRIEKANRPKKLKDLLERAKKVADEIYEEEKNNSTKEHL